MKNSEKLLVGGFLLVVVGWLIGPSLVGLVFGSSAQLEARQQSLMRDLATLEKLNQWKTQSLAAPDLKSGSAHRAEEQYRNWIWTLAEEVGGFKELNVAPGSRG
ncbi:MAG TPA: hypothetical protein DCE47_10075, partial [Planctomycetaceae bacterium]|nr:hypothetical protein [Planctomycetaceae bacterium]